MEKKKIELANPIEFGSEKVSQLEFREPTVMEYRGIRMPDPTTGLSIDEALGVASKCLTSHVPTILQKLRGIDVLSMKVVIESFLFAGAERIQEAEISSATV